MKVSIITPAYNSAAFIEKCILSVKNQDYESVEHIITDSASKDGSVDIFKKYEHSYDLKWVSEKDRGIADAMNKGFAMATGDIYAWVDADNYYYPGIVSKVVEIFRDNPQVDIIYGKIAIGIDENDPKKRIYWPKEVSFAGSLVQTTAAIPAQPGVFFRRKLFEKSGGFDTSYRVAGDYEFWVKVLREKPVAFFYDEIFGFYKLEEGAASQSAKGIWRGYKEMATIGKKYGQPLHGKMALMVKYAKGYVHKLING